MKNIQINENGMLWNLGLSGRARRDHMGDKSEVFVCINASGRLANSEPRFSLVFRFSPEAIKKISPRSSYSNAALVEELHRIYFREDRAGTGKKLSKTSAQGNKREIRFTIHENEKSQFQKLVGSYLLCFDSDLNLYYIDWEHKLVNDFDR